MKYTHSLANYPTSFLGVAMSKNRFCLQFQDVTVKLRKDLQNPDHGLVKLSTGNTVIPFDVHGSEINILAVRCTEDVILNVQRELLKQYKAYIELFPETGLVDKLKELGIDINETRT